MSIVKNIILSQRSCNFLHLKKSQKKHTQHQHHKELSKNAKVHFGTIVIIYELRIFLEFDIKYKYLRFMYVLFKQFVFLSYSRLQVHLHDLYEYATWCQWPI